MLWNLSSTCLIVVGTIAGGGGGVVRVNPIILGNIPGNGLILKHTVK